VDVRMLKQTFRAFGIAIALTCASAAQAAITVYNVSLSGAAESPPNASPGTGTATVTFDPDTHQLTVSMSFSGLTAGTTASHIHAATAVPLTGAAGVATQIPTFTGFPLGVTSGTYSNAFDTLTLATYNPAFVTANGGTAASAEAALFAAMNSGRAYLNIHTTAFPSGEIRGFLIAVPEASTWMMMVLGFGAVGMAMRRRRRALLTGALSA
jgi:CHRD domain/PEP-CTERM motif